MRNAEAAIIQRYFRKTQLQPDGAVFHHGDCDVFNIGICGCGLHHDLMPLAPELQMKLYSQFVEEHPKSEDAREFLFGRNRKRKK